MEDELTFRQVIDDLSAPIATVTPDGRVDLVNRQLLEYLGMSVENLGQWETWDAVQPDDLLRGVTAWRLSLERSEPYELDHRLRRADGIYRWTRWITA